MPSAFTSSAQIAVRWRSAAYRVGIDRGVTRNVDHDGAAPVPCGGGQGAEERFGQSERAQKVYTERLLQFLAFGIGKQRERRRSQGRCVIYERIEAPEITDNL